MRLLLRRRPPAQPATTAATSPRRLGARGERGQILVIFAGSIVLFMALLAVVADVSWYWANTLRVQRAADAAALAGAVYLPGDVAAATTAARSEARKNGYTHGTNSTVMPAPDNDNDRQLNVQISAPVGTFFMRVLGITSIQATRASKAEYVLPVPMGSPQNYYGVGFLRDAIETTSTSTSSASGDTGWGEVATTAPSGGQWSFSSGNIISAVASDDSVYAHENTNGQQQRWGTFGLATTGSSPIPFPAANQSVTIDGLVVRLTDTRVSVSCSNSRVNVQLSWDGGTSWSTAVATPNLTTTQLDYLLPSSGGSTGTAAWGAHNWVRADFTDANFQVRLTAVKGCSTSTTQLRVDMIEVRVYYTVETTTTTTTTTMEDVDVVSPYGQVLAPQNFWAGLQSQGAPNIQGDAYMTKYRTRTSVSNSDFAPGDYYNYAVEMPAGATGGEVWVFDPGMCDVRTQGGTGEYWTVGGANGYSSKRPANAFYDLYDTQETLYNDSDDSLVASSGSTFAGISGEDHDIYDELGATTSLADCADLAWHYDANDWQSGSPSTPRRGWYQLAGGLSGGAGGRTYRLHTHSEGGDQDNTTALNAFAIWATASGGTPRVYGLGAMEAYVRLPGGRASEFYLAQIDAVHAGKTMEIRLWDPGDTGALSASLEILAPGAVNYEPVTFAHSAESANPSSSACTSYSSSGTTAVTTNTGGSSRYNGCWLTIEIAIPSTYTAPHPSSDTVTAEAGWWKIRYSMGGSSADFSTDLTTWEVQIRGNPVHLKVP
jgi:Flp pilus assembly protein TadG